MSGFVSWVLDLYFLDFGLIILVFGLIFLVLNSYFGCLDLYFGFWTHILGVWTYTLGVRADGRAGGRPGRVSSTFRGKSILGICILKK